MFIFEFKPAGGRAAANIRRQDYDRDILPTYTHKHSRSYESYTASISCVDGEQFMRAQRKKVGSNQ